MELRVQEGQVARVYETAVLERESCLEGSLETYEGAHLSIIQLSTD